MRTSTKTGARDPSDLGSVNGGRRNLVLNLNPIHAARHQAARIEKMLRTEAALRPAAAIIEFDPQEIADFAENTVLYLAGQFAIRIADMKGGAERDRAVYL